MLGFAQGENKTDAKGLKQGEWKKHHKNDLDYQEIKLFLIPTYLPILTRKN